MNLIGYIEENPDIEVQDSVSIGISIPIKNKAWSEPRIPNDKKLALIEKSLAAEEVLLDYFINFEQPAKIVERKPSLDYYDNQDRRVVNRTNYENRLRRLWKGIEPSISPKPR